MNETVEYLPVDELDLIGGELSLDFVNTASAREAPPFRERLVRYDDLVSWSERVGQIDGARGSLLRSRAGARPGDADAVLMRARELREAIYRIFHSGMFEGVPPEADLAVLSREAAAASARRRLVSVENRVEFEWDRAGEPLDQLLWPIAHSAAELLVSDDRDRVKECATDNCNWLFLDASRNRSRRWCEMRECGNRAKARRHYARRRQTE